MISETLAQLHTSRDSNFSSRFNQLTNLFFVEVFAPHETETSYALRLYAASPPRGIPTTPRPIEQVSHTCRGLCQHQMCNNILDVHVRCVYSGILGITSHYMHPCKQQEAAVAEAPAPAACRWRSAAIGARPRHRAPAPEMSLSRNLITWLQDATFQRLLLQNEAAPNDSSPALAWSGCSSRNLPRLLRGACPMQACL